MTNELTHSDTMAEGNTNLPLFDFDAEYEGGTKDRLWCMTLNNYTEEEMTQMTQVFNEKKINWVIGREVGEQGTPHLQMFIRCKNAIRFSTLKNINKRMNISRAGEKMRRMKISNREKNKRIVKFNITYCCKDGDYSEEGFTKEIRDYINPEWKRQKIDMDITPMKEIHEQLRLSSRNAYDTFMEDYWNNRDDRDHLRFEKLCFDNGVSFSQWLKIFRFIRNEYNLRLFRFDLSEDMFSYEN